MKPRALDVTNDESEMHVFAVEMKAKLAVLYMNTNQKIPAGRPWKLKRDQYGTFGVMALTSNHQLVFLKRNLLSHLGFLL